MKIKFLRREIYHIFISWLMISVAFAILYRSNFLIAFFISLFTVGIGFIIHELSHKYFAQKFGCNAEFVANFQMLWVSLLLAFSGFIFIAPGAVRIKGFLSKEKYGIVSLSGPLSNLVLSLVFIISNIIYPNIIAYYGALVNAIFGLFNLLPFPMFDGIKVYKWNKKLYSISILLGLILLALIFF